MNTTQRVDVPRFYLRHNPINGMMYMVSDTPPAEGATMYVLDSDYADRDAEVERWQRVYASICVELVHAGIHAFGSADEAIHRLRDRAEAAERARDEACGYLVRYRNETPLGHQPSMIAHKVDAFLAANGGGK